MYNFLLMFVSLLFFLLVVFFVLRFVLTKRILRVALNYYSYVGDRVSAVLTLNWADIVSEDDVAQSRNTINGIGIFDCLWTAR